MYYAIGPCTTSLITGQYEVTWSLNLMNFLVSGGFFYPRTPAEPINGRLGYTVRGSIEAGGQMKCPRTAGLGYTNKNSAVTRVAPFFFKYLEGLLNRGWTLFCGAGVVYEPQLAKASTPCDVVSTRKKSVFVPGFVEVDGVWKDLWNGGGTLSSSGASERSPPVCWSISSPGVSGSTSCIANQR